MIDIHCHILPGFDDGARDMAESLAMAQGAVHSGVTGIVVTPHFRGEQRSLNYIGGMFDRFQRLSQAIENNGIPLQLYPGAEILCLPQTVEMARRQELPTLGDSNCLLCEFFFNKSIGYMDDILDGIAGCGYTPVVAHPERYQTIQHDPRGLERWFRRGYLIQLNKGSILGAFGYEEQMTADWIIKGGLAHMVASDAHGIHRRTTDMSQLRARMLEKYPPAYVKVMMDINPQRLIRGEGMYPAG